MAKSWFTLNFVNHQIANFKYHGHDKLSKPPTISKTATRLPGNASENWCFLRVFPILVYWKISDAEDSVWRLVMNLRSILEIVAAFSLTEIQILHLKHLVVDYVKDSREYFLSTQLRPKYHFLLHYPLAILNFGPLRNCSALRFESKHSYFKRLVASKKNFVNVCFTLAMNHQRLQACLLEFGIFPAEVQLQSLQNPNFADGILNVLEMQGVDKLSCVFVESFKFRGILHQLHEHLVLEKQGNDLKLGNVKVLFLFDRAPYAVYQTCHGMHMPDVGLYSVSMPTSDTDVSALRCINLADLCYVEPVHVYVVKQCRLLCLKHAFWAAWVWCCICLR